MTRITQIVGAVLIVVGLVSWIVTAFASWTALIPAIIGVVVLVLGILTQATGKPKLWTHIALVVALLGIVGTFMNVLKLGEVFAGTADRPAAIIASTITFVVLVVYIALGVRSFIAARRSRD